MSRASLPSGRRLCGQLRIIDGGIPWRPRPVSEKTRHEAIFKRGMLLAVRNMCQNRKKGSAAKLRRQLEGLRGARKSSDDR